MDSTGTFQLELGKAIEKMRSHQAESSYHYVNRLLRSCFLTGAQEVVVKSGGSKTRVEYDGAAFAPSRLAYLLEELFVNHGTAGHELANAANLAFGLSGCKVEIKLDDGHEAAMLVRNPDGASELFQLETTGLIKTSFQLNRGTGEKIRSFGTNSQEYLSVVRRFRLAPYTISINKEYPPRSHAWGRRYLKGVSWRDGIRLRNGVFSLGDFVCKHHHVVELRLYSPGSPNNGVGLHQDTSTSILRVGEGRQGKLDACRMAFGLCADTSLASTASWVYCGETLQVFPVRLSLPGVELVIDASDLQLDASQEKLVQDDAFKERWRETKNEFELFATALIEAYDTSSPKKLVTRVFFDKESVWAYNYEMLKAKAQERQGSSKASSSRDMNTSS